MHDISSVVTCLLSNQKLHFGIFISRYMSTAHSKMQKRVTDLVLESFGTQSYKKAMDCLRVLREESIKVHHCPPFMVGQHQILTPRLQWGSERRPRCVKPKLRLSYLDQNHFSGVMVVLRFRSWNFWHQKSCFFLVSVFVLGLKPVRHGFEPLKWSLSWHFWCWDTFETKTLTSRRHWKIFLKCCLLNNDEDAVWRKNLLYFISHGCWMFWDQIKATRDRWTNTEVIRLRPITHVLVSGLQLITVISK